MEDRTTLTDLCAVQSSQEVQSGTGLDSCLQTPIDVSEYTFFPLRSTFRICFGVIYGKRWRGKGRGDDKKAFKTGRSSLSLIGFFFHHGGNGRSA